MEAEDLFGCVAMELRWSIKTFLGKKFHLYISVDNSVLLSKIKVSLRKRYVSKSIESRKKRNLQRKIKREGNKDDSSRNKYAKDENKE